MKTFRSFDVGSMVVRRILKEKLRGGGSVVSLALKARGYLWLFNISDQSIV